MIVKEIMDITGQKKGVIEEFRRLLRDYGIISNNENIDSTGLKAFINAVEYKDKNTEHTWKSAMVKSIEEQYSCKIHQDIKFSKETQIKELIWLIQNRKLNKRVNLRNEEQFALDILCDSISENLNRTFHETRASIFARHDYIYYIIRLYDNSVDHTYVFYNEGHKFNTNRCKLLYGGNSKLDILEKLNLAMFSDDNLN